MMISSKIKLGTALALLAVPAVALGVGEGGSGIESVGLQQMAWNHGATNNNTGWKPVPGLAFNPNLNSETGSVAVSADMRKGPAMFRVVTVQPGGDTIAEPGAVRFNATGSQAMTFHVGLGCAGGIRVEWKPTDGDAVLNAATAHAVYTDTGCG
jgi:hypothetical protein